jgi:hypothetical protein
LSFVAGFSGSPPASISGDDVKIRLACDDARLSDLRATEPAYAVFKFFFEARRRARELMGGTFWVHVVFSLFGRRCNVIN